MESEKCQKHPYMKVSEIFHQVAAHTEDAVDIARRRIWKRLGRNRSQQFAAYRGYETPEVAEFPGGCSRINPAVGRWMTMAGGKNLVNTYRRWESDEVPFAEVVVRYGEEEIRTQTDEEGYYHAEFPIATSDRERLLENCCCPHGVWR